MILQFTQYIWHLKNLFQISKKDVISKHTKGVNKVDKD